MTQLEQLAAAIEAGTATRSGFSRCFGTPCQDVGLQNREYDARYAYNGSLDAAKALHEAMLPVCNQYTIDEGPSGCRAHIVIWPNGLSGQTEHTYEGYDGTPARAWLLAIVRALIAKDAAHAKALIGGEG